MERVPPAVPQQEAEVATDYMLRGMGARIEVLRNA